MGGIDIKGKNALVTGGSKRLGEAIAKRLASCGANIVIHYRSSESEARGVSKAIESMGVCSWVVSGDLASSDGIPGLFADAKRLAGPVDILVNSAAIFNEDRILGFAPSSLFGHVETNALAPLLLAREFAREQRAGSIVNILDSRITDYDSHHASYHLSKRMLSDITSMLAIELAPLVRVNAVAPGLILPPPGKDETYVEERKHTNLLRSRGTPEDVADAVLFLVTGSFVTGQTIYVDGGRHLKGRVYES
jgi:pteridine reductase